MATTPDFDDIDIDLLIKKKETKTLIKILRWSQVKEKRKQAAHAIGDIIMRERYPDYSDKLDYAGKEQMVMSQIVPELIRVLQNDSDEVRYAAIEALAATRDLRATEALVNVLNSDTEPKMIAAASRALSSLGSTENQVIDAMLALLSSESILVREAVSSSLSDILYGTDIVANSQGLAERLVESMVNEVDEKVRIKIGQVLRFSASMNVYSLLVKKLEDDRDYLRAEFVFLLGKLCVENSRISVRKTVAPLVSALQDKASEVRFNAALSVINIIKKSKLDYILYNKGNSFCGYKIWNAEFVFDKKELNQALEYLIIMLKKDDAKLRSTAAALLGEIENELALEDLIKALDDSDEIVRLEAAKALGMLKSSRAFKPLLKALKCESNSIKMAVVEALGKLEDNRSIEPLMNIIKNDHSKDVRARAVDALRAYRCENIYDILAEALQDVDAIVRKSAADVMGLLAEPKAVAPLAVALIDKNVKVRHKAALALGDIGGVQAAGILLEAKMTEKNKYVIRGINEALGIIKDVCVVDFRTKRKY